MDGFGVLVVFIVGIAIGYGVGHQSGVNDTKHGIRRWKLDDSIDPLDRDRR